VNAIQPDVQWSSLGTIARHLYLIRRADDGTYVVRAYSPDIVLHNPDRTVRKFRVIKADSGSVPVLQVLVDGRSIPYSRPSDGHLQIQLTVPHGEVRHIQIIYRNDFDPAKEDLAKRSLRINLLRHLSDIRDQYLSAGPVGNFIQQYYYDSNLYQFGLEVLAGIAVVALILLAGLIWITRTVRIKRRV
jgi:hypothetical protein